MPPPNGTLLFPKLANVSHWLLGIDTQFFQAKAVFRGIKNIPPGVHFLHYATNPSTVRHGFWFAVEEGDVLQLTWNEEEERLVVVELSEDVGAVYSYMVEYPVTSDQWTAITSHVDLDCVADFIDIVSLYLHDVSTMTSSQEEAIALDETLRSKNPTHPVLVEPVLRYTIVDHRQKRPGHGPLVSQDHFDRLWVVQSLYDPDTFLAELEVCYVHFVVLANFCLGVQWTNMLRLMLTSSEYLQNHPAFTLRWLAVWAAQLEVLPKEYLMDESQSLLNLEQYVGAVENLVAMQWGGLCGKLKMQGKIEEKWAWLKALHETKLGLRLHVLEKKTHDGFEVYELDSHDPNDEDAPVIV